MEKELTYKTKEGNISHGFERTDIEENTRVVKYLTIWATRLYILILVGGFIACCVLVFFIWKYPIFARSVNAVISCVQ